MSVPKMWWLWGKHFLPISLRIWPLLLEVGISTTGFELQVKKTLKVQNQNAKMSFILPFLPQFFAGFETHRFALRGRLVKEPKGDFAVTFTKSPPPVKQHQQKSSLMFCLLVEKVQILPVPGVLRYHPEKY